ncbi:MAG: MBL fold metallo-hydrolase [Candidatus Rokubacteria bacterium]|nr:MBL fold metallo-hydrolase [Candidatus Rokubacteria bacterium]
MRKRQRLWVGAGVAFVWTLGVWIIGAQAQTAPVKMEWFSWSIFRFTSPTGKVVLTNPFVMNPDSPIKAADLPKVDVVLVADGHPDEVGSTDEIALKTGAKVITTGEMIRGYFEPRKIPMAQLLRGNPGDWHRLDGITVRSVNSVHGSGTAERVYGGPALGFMVTFENGLTVYFAGSTALTLDMQLWGSLYRPHVAILPLAGNRDPQDIVHMVRLLRSENPNLKTVIPHHHRLKPPPGASTPADLETTLKASGLPVTLLNPELGKVYELSR